MDSKEHTMDNPDRNIETGPEYKATMITAKEATEKAMQVFDRVTGEAYNPQERFDQLMNKPEIMAMLKRLSVR
jgi:hypothetical protein